MNGKFRKFPWSCRGGLALQYRILLQYQHLLSPQLYLPAYDVNTQTLCPFRPSSREKVYLQKSHIRPKLRQTTIKAQRNSQIHLVIPRCRKIFCYHVIHPLIHRSLKCSLGSWLMYRLLKLTLVQQCTCIYELLDNRAWYEFYHWVFVTSFTPLNR